MRATIPPQILNANNVIVKNELLIFHGKSMLTVFSHELKDVLEIEQMSVA